MKVNVSVVGRFHAFNLAQELEKAGKLNKLITTYPSSVSGKWVDNSKSINKPYLEILNRYRHKIPIIDAKLINNYVKKKLSSLASQEIQNADINVAWFGNALEMLIQLNEKNINDSSIGIVVRGSTHFSTQVELLTEAYSELGLKYKPDYIQWERELLEYELADYIQTNSSFARNSYINNGIPANKIIVANTGVDIDEFCPSRKRDNVFRVIVCGSGIVRKGLHITLKAFDELNLPNSELWHIGSIHDEIKPFISQYLNNPKIKFFGHQKQSDLHKFYSQSSIFVLMSIEEGLAMVQAQSMACGIPIICTENTGGGDLIDKSGGGGFIINRNIVDLKCKILELYEDEALLATHSKIATDGINEHFKWSDYGNRIISQYISLIS